MEIPLIIDLEPSHNQEGSEGVTCVELKLLNKDSSLEVYKEVAVANRSPTTENMLEEMVLEDENGSS